MIVKNAFILVLPQNSEIVLGGRIALPKHVCHCCLLVLVAQLKILSHRLTCMAVAVNACCDNATVKGNCLLV